jgi:cell division protein FtsB
MSKNPEYKVVGKDNGRTKVQYPDGRIEFLQPTADELSAADQLIQAHIKKATGELKEELRESEKAKAEAEAQLTALKEENAKLKAEVATLSAQVPANPKAEAEAAAAAEKAKAEAEAAKADDKKK